MLLAGVEVLSPVDELRRVHDRLLRGWNGAEDGERRDRLQRALEIAGSLLEKMLGDAAAREAGGEEG